jgi:magnesium-transporting ATPase (P-type)
MNADGTIDSSDLYAGSMVLQGDAIAVVTAIGTQTLLAKLIQQKMWPPSKEYEAISTMDDNNNNAIELT